MKNIIIFIFALSINLIASYVVVDDQSVGGESDGDVTIFDFSKDLDTLQVSQQDVVLAIPVYVNSDSTTKEQIDMTLSDITTLKNSSNEVITTTLSYKSINGATEITISDGSSFTLLSSGEGERDGTTIEGYIYVKISSVPNNATVGDYSLTANLSISSNGTTSSSSQLSVGTSVALVAVAGFEDTSNQTMGKRLIGGSVNFGIFSFTDQNQVIKPLFIKNNSSEDFKISFETKPLKHIDDPDNYSIGMKYSYNNTPITSNTKFTALSGKNDGGTKVADLKFETDTLDDSLISGDYQTTLNITITLE